MRRLSAGVRQAIFPRVTFLPARAALRQVLLLALLAAPAAAQIRLPKALGGTAAQRDSLPHTDSALRVVTRAAAVENGSPRQSMERFFQLAREGRWKEAAHYLSTDPTDSARGAELAEHLKVVLDRYLWIDLDQLSPLAEGDTTDGLKGALDQVGVVPRPTRPPPAGATTVTCPKWPWCLPPTTSGSRCSASAEACRSWRSPRAGA